MHSKTHKVPLILASATTSKTVRHMDGLAGAYRNFFFSNTTAFVAYSNAASEFIHQIDSNQKPVFLARNAIDNQLYFHEVKRRKTKADELKQAFRLDGPVLLFVGRLEPEKGLDILSDAFEHAVRFIPDMHLVFVGDGSQRPTLESKLAKVPNVHFIGFTNPVDLPTYYYLADALVLPSIRETWGMVINEAMASGLPIIISDACGAAHEAVIHEENGYVFPSGNTDALSAFIVKLFSDTASRKRMSNQSRRLISKYSIEKAADNIVMAVEYAYANERYDHVSKN